MKLITRGIVIICLSLFICNCQETSSRAEEKTSPDRPVNLATEKDKVSYIIGVNMATSLMPIIDELDPEMLKKGFDDRMADQPLLVSEEDARTILQNFSQKMKSRQMQEQASQAADNKAAGEEFLAKNADKNGVVTTDSGLQYKVVRKGNGPVPSATDTVKVNYEGRTIDGEVFDSSYKRGQPATFKVNQVITGWQEALQLMPVGSKYELFIPSDLAYGEAGVGGQIGPNAVLVFDVELLDIVKPDKNDKMK